ncbi:MAG: aminotransferase class I/II-fold pyridoxal phosphate-dependent enzyme, partial [Candidatus Eisenbacteria bacterium]|nr:aminotransferase class I/II-fold pyridoxal phosphate-dependent enzyme [Candidatus Eisenbacteria bacterium]
LSPYMERAARLARSGRDPIVLAQAMVDLAPPARFTRALEEALASGEREVHRYAPDPGLPELRGALSGYLERSFGFSADPATELIVTPGANHAAYLALSTILDPGDEALLISPWYFNHLMTLQLAGAEVRHVTAVAADGFRPRLTDLDRLLSRRTRALVLVNPNNPSGARYPDAWIDALADLLTSDSRWARVWLLCDQTYQEIFFSGGHPRSLGAQARLRERVITVGSFSKCFAIAGWRVGFLAAPERLVSEALKIQDSSVICAPRAAQWAVTRALQEGRELERYFAELRATLRNRRDALSGDLADAPGLELVLPGGSCFAMLGLPEGTDGEAFADALLDEYAVATVPGRCFGPEWRNSVRLSFGTETEERLAEAGARIRKLAARRPPRRKR